MAARAGLRAFVCVHCRLFEVGPARSQQTDRLIIYYQIGLYVTDLFRIAVVSPAKDRAALVEGALGLRRTHLLGPFPEEHRHHQQNEYRKRYDNYRIHWQFNTFEFPHNLT
ncbi:MAG: hypothetical protein ACP5E4_04425 [Candidatus Aenigmatarchaeota archaeon]